MSNQELINLQQTLYLLNKSQMAYRDLKDTRSGRRNNYHDKALHRQLLARLYYKELERKWNEVYSEHELS